MNRIDGVPMEFDWKILPGFTTLGELQCEPEQVNDRVVFMSMYNDIVWWEEGNAKKCESNSPPRKVAEQRSDENTTSQIIEEKTARTEPSKEFELKRPKESDTVKVADVKIVVDSLWHQRECEELEHSLTKLQEELEAESMNELEWQCQSQMNEDPIARQDRIMRSSCTRKRKEIAKQLWIHSWRTSPKMEARRKSRKRCRIFWDWLRQESEVEKYPTFRASSAFERGELRSEGHGKKSIHFNGGEENSELLLRTIISANQLSVYGALADLCRELSKDSMASGETCSTWSFGDDGNSYWTSYCWPSYRRTPAGKPVARRWA